MASPPALAVGLQSTLGALITVRLEMWPKDLKQLQQLNRYADDASFQEEFMAIKHANKVDFAQWVEQHCGEVIDPHALFDVQIKRLHEYKRQHLNLLHILRSIDAC